MYYRGPPCVSPTHRLAEPLEDQHALCPQECPLIAEEACLCQRIRHVVQPSLAPFSRQARGWRCPAVWRASTFDHLCDDDGMTPLQPNRRPRADRLVDFPMEDVPRLRRVAMQFRKIQATTIGSGGTRNSAAKGCFENSRESRPAGSPLHGRESPEEEMGGSMPRAVRLLPT
jgi:hypothetical protein